LGERTGVELPEYIGQRANRETKAQQHTGDDNQWYTGDSILAAIGQSEHRFTPIQLCSYTMALANQGNRYKATFMNRVVSADYRQLLEDNKPELLSHMDISDETYAAYSEGMYLVTSELYGTAYSTFKNYPVKVAAKTGTAETGIIGTSANGAFVCYAPLEDPQIAIAIYVEKAGHGSTLASIAKNMLDVYFDVDEVGDVVSFENQLS
jgi:penicillin-binding protein 2